MGSTLVSAGRLDELQSAGKKVLRHNGKQVLLLATETGVYACNNQCPHQGYPLSEGTLSDGCVLTCNWHNWKFNLETGETSYGGDALRDYPVEVRDGEIFVDMADMSQDIRRATVIANLKSTFDTFQPDRLAREVARLMVAKIDPLIAVREAIHLLSERHEYGSEHDIGAAPDWLYLLDHFTESEEEEIVAIVEVLAYMNWQTLRHPAYPFAEGTLPYAHSELVEAIDAEDERTATLLIRGALEAGVPLAELRHALGEAALLHYADFGHSVIYVHKTFKLIERLGIDVAEPLLLGLVRSVVYGYREDLIPEFRGLGAAVQEWDGTGDSQPSVEQFVGASVNQAIEATLAASASPKKLYEALLEASALNVLKFDASLQHKTDAPVSQNIGWLGFTHGITFGNAGRALATDHPELWPRLLLQMACFVGRNVRYVDHQQDSTMWAVDDADEFLKESFRNLLDHGDNEFIYVAHHIKTTAAVLEELEVSPDAPFKSTLLAALNRFLHAPIKERHTLRTATQSLAFARAES